MPTSTQQLGAAAFNKKRRKYNSGEVRTKSGDIFNLDSYENDQTTRIISKSALDSLQFRRTNNNRNNFKNEQPMNDKDFEDLASLNPDQDSAETDRLTSRVNKPEHGGVAFRSGVSSNQDLYNNDDNLDNDETEDEDDEDYDDPTANQQYIQAYKEGGDPNKILNSWKNNKKHNQSSISNSQQQSSPYLSSLTNEGTNTAAGRQSATNVVLSSGLITRLPGPPRDLVAQIIKPRFVTLSWMEPSKNPVEVVSYTVFYKMKNSER